MAAKSWFQRLLSYTVDLISVLRNLFSTALTATWDGLQGTYGDYEQSGSRQNFHGRILSKHSAGWTPKERRHERDGS